MTLIKSIHARQIFDSRGNPTVEVDTILDKAGTGAPQLDYGAEVLVGQGITGAGGINISGVATASSFDGTATGLMWNPYSQSENLSVMEFRNIKSVKVYSSEEKSCEVLYDSNHSMED